LRNVTLVKTGDNQSSMTQVLANQSKKWSDPMKLKAKPKLFQHL